MKKMKLSLLTWKTQVPLRFMSIATEHISIILISTLLLGSILGVFVCLFFLKKLLKKLKERVYMNKDVRRMFKIGICHIWKMHKMLIKSHKPKFYSQEKTEDNKLSWQNRRTKTQTPLEKLATNFRIMLLVN